MAVKVTLNTTGSNRVAINNQNRTTIRTVGISPISPASLNRLDLLIDVDASDPDNNETLVYDSSSQKYVVKTLPIIDGGTY